MNAAVESLGLSLKRLDTSAAINKPFRTSYHMDEIESHTERTNACNTAIRYQAAFYPWITLVDGIDIPVLGTYCI